MRGFYTPDKGPESGGDFLELSEAGGLKRFLIGSMALAAVSKFAIDEHTRHTTDAVLLRSAGHIGLMHIKDFNITGRARQAVDQDDGFVASRAASSEDFDFSFCSHGELPP